MSGSNRTGIPPAGRPFLAWLAALAATGAFGATDIPDRPEKLVLPPLRYDPPDPAQFRVALRSGPVAYVVPDRELPLVNLSILVRTGAYLDPAGKEGLAQVAGHLLARGGVRSKTAEELEERLAFLAASLESSVGDSQGNVSLNLLAKDLDEGLALLREVLAAPRFQEDRLALHRRQLLLEMKRRNDDSRAIEGLERPMLAYGESFWINRHATQASLDAIGRADLEHFHRQWFHPSNFVVAVNGDFARDAMVAKLEALFADWPFRGETPPPIPTNTAFAAPGVYLVHKAVNQGRVSVLLPGVRRDDPDYFAILAMNDILGGGGFSSRIVSRVRSDEGLAYSAGSSFPGGVYYPQTFTAGLQTKSRTVAYAVGLVLAEMKRMADEPVTDAELATTQRGFIDRFPRTFSSKAAVAGTLADDEFTGRYARDPHYWSSVRGRLEAVTRADIQRVARKYLVPDRVAILIVGDKQEILLGHPDHPERLKDFAGGRFVELPLRDPLTLRPLPPAPAPTPGPAPAPAPRPE
jgi:predicted Zn-dependent peptidase